jgi:hypothetical protein
MSASIDIPACHSARNRTIISGNQVLCASPEGISQDLYGSRPFFGPARCHCNRPGRDDMVSINMWHVTKGWFPLVGSIPHVEDT